MRLKRLFAVTGTGCDLAAVCTPVHAQQQQAPPRRRRCARTATKPSGGRSTSPRTARRTTRAAACARRATAAPLSTSRIRCKAKPANPFGKGHTADERTAVCLTCHSGNRNLAFWTSGKHQLNEVTCSNCHSIHGKSLAPSINKFVTTFLPNQADICGNCHQPIRAATFKPSHHPIIEGKIKCTDCHNPHGAITPAMLKQPTINDQCYSCHADKRGPYVFNHPPVEENCATCHNPHGSVHARLLNESAPNLCQDCHDGSRHPGTHLRRGRRLHLPAGRHLARVRRQDRTAQRQREHPPRGPRVPQLPQRDPWLERAG